MSHQKTTVTQQKEHKFDILAVLRLIKGTIYREKTEIINPWESLDPPAPLNDAPVNVSYKKAINLTIGTVGLQYYNKWAVSNPVCRCQNAWSIDRRRCRRSQAMHRVFGFWHRKTYAVWRFAIVVSTR